jgi:hypothetical protein
LNASYVQNSAWQEKIGDTVSSTWAKSTASKYSLGIKRYQQFCEELNIPENLWLPASDNILCAFAANEAGRKAGRAVRNNMAAIRAWHIQNNLPWKTSTRLTYVLKGCEKLTPKESQKKK